MDGEGFGSIFTYIWMGKVHPDWYIILTLTALIFYSSSFQVHIQQGVKRTESKPQGCEAEGFGQEVIFNFPIGWNS